MIDAPPNAEPLETPAAERIDPPAQQVVRCDPAPPPVPDGPVYFHLPSGATVNLDGWYAGRSCFLTCGGPSLADANHDLLRKVVTFGLNNSWATFRPNLWTCWDPPERFCDQGWKDPRIVKVVPRQFERARLRHKDAEGKFHPSKLLVRDCPSVLMFDRNTQFDPADFFAQRSVCGGHARGSPDAIGIEGYPSVMLAAVRLAHALGFRTLYLVGCDFKMPPQGPGYSFAQDRAPGVRKHNERLYRALRKRFAALLPYMEFSGFQVFNCTPSSALEVFEHKRLSEAVADATRECGEMSPEKFYDGPPPPPVNEYAVYRQVGE